MTTDASTSATGTRLGLWFRADGTTEWTPTDPPAQEITALTGKVDTGLAPGSDVTLRVQTLSDAGALVGDAGYATTTLTCEAPVVTEPPTTAPAPPAPPDTSPPDTSPPDTAPPVTDTPAPTPPPTAVTAPPTQALSPDDDGVAADIENGAPNAGDGNGDGVPDAWQANVASLPSQYDVNGDGALNDYVTIESPASTSLLNVRTLVVPADNPPPDGATLPAGLIDYDVQVANAGGRADVKLHLPDGEQSSVYMFQDGTWKNFDQHSAVDDSADQVTLNLSDGGPGDQSGTDGVIHDPVGVGTPAANGTITSNKVAADAGGQTFDFRLQSCTNTGSSTPSSCSGAVTVGDRTGVPDGDYGIWSGLTDTAGSWYYVTEFNIPAGWVLSSVSCSGGRNSGPGTNGYFIRLDDNNGDAGRHAECTFTNTRIQISITKQTTPDGAPGNFDFRLERCNNTSGTTCTSFAPAQFVSPDPETLSDGATATWALLETDRVYRLTETVPAGWTLTNRTCTGGASSGTDAGSNGRIIRLDTGANQQQATCTFTDTRNQISITKQTTPDGAPGTFDFRLERCDNTSGTTCTSFAPAQFVSPDPQNLGDNQTATWVGLETPRVYRLTETVPGGWTLSRSCTGGGSSNTNSGTNGRIIRLDTGNNQQQASCTFTNTAPLSIKVGAVGDRTGGGTTPPQADFVSGITFQAYTDANGTNPVGGATCVTDGTGTCSILNLLAPATYYVGATSSANPTFDAITGLNAGDSPDTTQPKRYVRQVQLGGADVDISASAPFLTRRHEPGIPTKCGLKVALLFDVSSSIDSTELGNMKTAANGFVTNLAGTPTEVSQYTFGSDAPSTGSGNGNHAAFLNLANPADVTTAHANINALSVVSDGNYTNWDAALRQIVGSGADMVIMMTDGDPTTYGVPHGPLGSTDYLQIENGIASANQVKASGVNVIGVGIGLGGNSAPNLKAISGDASPYYFESNFGDLASTLAQIASAQCGGTLTVTKTIDGAVTADSAGWTFQAATSAGTITGTNPATTTNSPLGQVQWSFTNVPGGGASVTVTETALLPNFTFLGAQCTDNGSNITTTVDANLRKATFTLLPGSNHIYACKLDNHKVQQASIELKKVWSGTKGDVTLRIGTSAGGSQVDSQVLSGVDGTTSANPVNAGTYYVSETVTNAGDYDSGLVCTKNANPLTPDANGGFPVAGGDVVVCTYTNTRKQGSVELKKVWSGTEGDVTLRIGTSAGGDQIASTALTGTDGTTGPRPVDTGTYYVSETDVPGFTASLACTKNGNPLVPNGDNGFSVAKSDVVVCTFENSLNTATVKVVKTIGDVPQNGWTIDASGPSSPMQVSPASVVTNAATPAEFTLDHVANGGSTVQLGEVLQDGYTAGGVTCVADGKDDQSSETVGVTLTVHKGETWTCTWSNRVNTATVKVLKKIGADQVAGWTVNASGPSAPMEVAPGSRVTTASGTVDFALSKVAADGSSLDLDEVLQAGFSAGDVTCVADGADDQTGSAGSVTVTVKPGETWTCTFENSVNTATVKVLKKIGEDQVAGWTVNASGPSAPMEVAPGSRVTTASGTVDFALSKVAADGSSLDLDEVLQAGFTAGDVTCVAEGEDDQSGSAGSVTVTVKPGETWTCTFENSLNTATVKVVKTIGDVPQDGWTIDASGPSSPMQVSPASVVTNAATPAEFTLDHVANGGSTVQLGEVLQDGYTAGGVTCVADGKDDQSSETVGVTLTVRKGETWTCTWSNRVNTATVKVLKKIDGEAVAGWTIDGSVPAGGTGRFTPPNATNGGLNASGTTTNDAGNPLTFGLTTVSNNGTVVDLAEIVQNGYSVDSVQCVNGQATQDGADGAVSVTVHSGETWTCTFTNKANEGTIKVLKKVDDVVTQGWTIDGSVPAGGPGRFTGGATTTQGVTTSDENAPLTFGLTRVAEAGTPVDLDEVLQAGFTAGDVTCVAEGEDDQSGSAGSVTVTVHKGETWTCTFENSLNTATVTAVKKIDGEAVAGWTINATNPSAPMEVSPGSRVTTASGTVDFALSKVAAGGSSVHLAEENQTGYSAGAVSCTGPSAAQNGSAGAVDVTVKPGETWTCTFENSVNTATVKVLKKIGEDQVAGWTIDATNPSAPMEVAPGSRVTTASGTVDFALSKVAADGSSLDLDEVLQAGFTAGDVTCVAEGEDDQSGSAGSVTVTVHKGETWTCTFENSVNTATVKVVKKIGEDQVAGWTIDATNPSAPMEVAPGSRVTTASGTVDFALSKVAADGSSLDLDEVNQVGYSAGDVTCVAEGADDQSGSAGSVTVTVKPDETWTCTFENSVNTGTIHVLKKVDGVQTAGWTVNASGPSAPMEVAPGSRVTTASGTVDFALSKVAAGGSSLHLAEVNQGGFSAGAVSCTGPSPAQNGSAGAVDVTVKPGETWTCTFNNSLNTATITVVKHIGVGTTDSAGWQIGGSVSSGQSGRFTGSHATNAGLAAAGATTGSGNPPLTFTLDHVPGTGTTVTLSETLQAQFSFGGFSCADGNSGVPVTISGHGGKVTVDPGSSIVCTFVNDPAGVGLTKTPSAAFVTAGQQLTFTLTGTNTTNVPLHNMIFTDTLDPALTFVSSADGCSAVGQLVTCGPYFPLGSELLPGQSKTVSFVVQVGVGVPAGTTILNVGHVTADPADGPSVTATAPASVGVFAVAGIAASTPSVRVGGISAALPYTGSPTAILLKSGLWLVAGGALLLIVNRRLRRRQA